MLLCVCVCVCMCMCVSMYASHMAVAAFPWNLCSLKKKGLWKDLLYTLFVPTLETLETQMSVAPTYWQIDHNMQPEVRQKK